MSTSEAYASVLLALAVWREARGQAQEARRGVLWTIRNRAAAGFRGKTAVDVILWPAQFSSFGRTDPNALRVPNPASPGDWRAWLECCALVDEPGADPTGGAVYYHSYPDGSDRWPDWAEPAKQTARIGPFRFYR